MVKILNRNDRQELFDGNTLVGYVESGLLYGIDKDGYAVSIDYIATTAEITAMFNKWKAKQ